MEMLILPHWPQNCRPNKSPTLLFVTLIAALRFGPGISRHLAVRRFFWRPTHIGARVHSPKWSGMQRVSPLTELSSSMIDITLIFTGRREFGMCIGSRD